MRTARASSQTNSNYRNTSTTQPKPIHVAVAASWTSELCSLSPTVGVQLKQVLKSTLTITTPLQPNQNQYTLL
jgi:hypothetical protein